MKNKKFFNLLIQFETLTYISTFLTNDENQYTQKKQIYCKWVTDQLSAGYGIIYHKNRRSSWKSFIFRLWLFQFMLLYCKIIVFYFLYRIIIFLFLIEFLCASEKCLFTPHLKNYMTSTARYFGSIRGICFIRISCFQLEVLAFLALWVIHIWLSGIA